MACVRRRRGKWICDYRDGAGIRRWVTCETRREAEAILAEKVRESRQHIRPAVDPNITLASYAERWLGLIAPSVKPRTLHSYCGTLRLHILPAFGTTKVRELHKGRIKALLAEKLASGLARNSARIILATLRVVLNAAVDDVVLLANPADKLGKKLRLTRPASARSEDIKALTREQLERFLTKAAEKDSRHYPLFLLLARAGLRLGEALAVMWQDLDFSAREIRVARALSAGRIDTPKSGHGRSVDMSRQLAETLFRLQIEREAEAALRQAEVAGWVFCTEAGTWLDQSKVRKVFQRILLAADLPPHFSPHSLRHTFASLLLQQGESPAYVQRQLGHASIQLTCDTYGKWLPAGNKAAVDRLDESRTTTADATRGSKMVAKVRGGPVAAPKLSDFPGAGERGRTSDLLITNQLLCH